MMPITGKLVAVVVLSSYLLLQQVQARPATQRSPAITNKRNPDNIDKREINSNSAIHGYPSNGAYGKSFGSYVPQKIHPGLIGTGDGQGNFVYLICHDCGHGRRRK
uniref:Secreted protein n=1 Tax=Plectus sambesii TaxID=2011161 RepID=A0A914XNI5_9BILA